MTTKLSRYKDWYETTDFDAERFNWNDRNFAAKMLFQTWNKFAQINVSSVTIFNIAVICSREARKMALYQCYG